MTLQHIRWAGALVAVVLALAGCWDGDDAPSPAPVAQDQVPPEAVASTPAYAAFLQSLPASETAEPLQLAGAVPPTSETEDPVEINWPSLAAGRAHGGPRPPTF